VPKDGEEEETAPVKPKVCYQPLQSKRSPYVKKPISPSEEEEAPEEEEEPEDEEAPKESTEATPPQRGCKVRIFMVLGLD
jgi:hypothetical protein